MLRSNNARGRIGLLASSSLVASTLMTGLGGVALTAFTPAVALASCTPTTAGTTSGVAANAKGVQTCGAGDPGVYYAATGNLNLDFTGEPVAPNGVGVTQGATAWNVILGINTTTETAGNISNAGGAGISLSGGTGGDVEVDTGSAALGSFAGATVTGATDGIDTTTGGSGTTKVNVYNTVTGTTGSGISVTAGSGAVSVNAMTNTGGGVTVTGGGTASAGILVSGGGAVTINAPGNTAGGLFGGIIAFGAVGSTTVTAGNTSGGNAINVTNSAGSVTVNSNGTATGVAPFAGIYATTGSGDVTVTTGDVVNGIVAGGLNTGTVTVTTNGNVTGANGIVVDSGSATAAASSAIVTINGNVNNNALPTDFDTGVTIDESAGSGSITLTSKAGTDISSSNGAGVVLKTGSGSITANLSGTVGGAEQVAGDGIDATSTVNFTKSTISITTAGVNAAGNGIFATNGGSGFTSVTVNGNVSAGGVGITANTDAQDLANGTGADTVTLAGNVAVTAGGDGIDMTVSSFGNATVTLSGNNTITAGGNGISVQGFGTGSINIVTATKDDQSGQIQATGFLSDGIVAIQGNTATGGINIDFGGNVSTTDLFGGSGIVAEIDNTADTSDITIRAGNVSVVQGVGIFASTLGAGDINVTTLKGTDVSSLNGDGIDAFGLGGGNVTVTLLDGTVNSHISGSAVQPFPSAGVPTGPGPTGPSAPKADPHGVYMIAVVDGTATLNQNSDVNNLGPGAAILSTTVDGNNTLNINANVTNTVGDAIDAFSSGNGVVTVNLFNAVTPPGEGNQTQNSVTITTTGGNGILAENTNTIGTQTAMVTSTAGAPGPLSVTVVGGLTGSAGISAVVNGSAVGSSASVNLSNAPGNSSITVDGAGANVGIQALAMDGAATSFAGVATVATGAGLSVTVGAAGGDGDVGILAATQDGDHQGVGAGITIGDSNTISVGSAGATGSVGVEAISSGSAFGGNLSGDGVSISGGNQDVITVTGSGSIGVEATIGGGAHGSPQALDVSFGNGGAITVNDTAGDPGVGVLAVNNDADGGGSVTVALGSTSIAVTNGIGIEAVGAGNNTVSVTSLGNITAGNNGIEALSSSGAVFAGYNNSGTGSATMNFGGAQGVEAVASGPGNVSATVHLGNGVGQTTIHGTDTLIVSGGVLASASGTGAATISSKGNVTVDPTEYAQEATSPLGQARVTTGVNDVNDVSDPLGVAPEHFGLGAFSGQTAGTASAVVTISNNNTISITGLAGDMSGSAGVAAVDDAGGDLVVDTAGFGGKGGSGLSITVGGDDSAGIVASTIGGDGTGGFYGTDLGSAGNVTVNTGAGNIAVGGTDTTGVDANNNFNNAYGIFTATNGGDTSVDNLANITVNNGAGEGTVGIASLNTGSGSSTISLTNSGGIAAGSVGIAAIDTDFFNTGGVVVNNTGNITMVAGPVATYTLGGETESVSVGILAEGGLGNVSVTNAGAISQADYGIVGEASGNVVIANSGNISAGSAGILAFSDSGTVLVNNTAATINVSVGDGIEAFAFSGTITVNQGNGSITAGNTAISAQTLSSGSVTVNNQGTLTGTAGDGISAISGSGSVSVSSTGPSVTGGIDAIYAQAESGTVTVGTALAPITSVLGSAITTDAAIRTVAGSGTTTIVTGNTASMAADNNATYGVVANSTSGAINITNAAQIGSAGEGVNGVGIFAGESATGTTGAITIVNTGNIYAKTNNAFTVTVGSFGLTGTAGIMAINNGNGAIDITNSGTIDPPAIGIGAVTFGNIGINNSGNIAASSVGITALSVGGGTVSVNNTAATINVSAGNGLDAGSLGGSGSITVTQGTGTITANVTGIEVLGHGSSAELITSAGTITGVTGDGILADGGPGSITVDTFEGGNVTGGTNGIVTSLAGGTGTTEIDTLDSFEVTAIVVTGQGGDGINATSSSTGDIDVDAANVTGENAAGHTSNGIVASSTGGGSVDVFTVGNIIGDAVGNAGGTGATGITATTLGGNGSVFVETEAPSVDGGEGNVNVSVTAGNYGIRASSVGAGSTTVEVGELSESGTVTVSATGNTTVNGNLGPVGIWAVGGTGDGNIGAANGVEVLTDGIVIAANGRGIVTNSGNNADIEIDGGAVVGLGDASHPVIDVTAPTGATTTITNFGEVMSNAAWTSDEEDAQFVGAVSALAVRGTTGSVSVDNEGFLVGRVNFSGLTGTSTASIINDGEWDTNGVSTLAPTGNDTITNDGEGLIATSVGQVATTIVFGNMTNTFTNAGELDVGVDDLTTGSASAPAVTTLSGTLTFNNSGLVVLGAPTYGAGTSDRIVNAILDAPGAAWVGSGESQIDLDANLWSTPQGATDCTNLVLTAADCLIVGSTSGSTAIQVLDTETHPFGAYNPTGIAIVVGSSAADTFHLASTSQYFDNRAADAPMFGGFTGGVLNKPGLFFYDLAYDSGASTEVLVGLPKASAFEFATFAGAMDGLWYTTTQTWFDRTTDQRDSLQGRADGTQPAVWLKAVGDWTNRTQSSSITNFGTTYTFNTSFDQSTAGLLGGVDLLHVAQKDQAWTFGVETGWVQSDLRFTASPDTLGASATDLGGYVTFLSGGLFVDGVVNANFLRLNDDLPALGVPPVGSDTHGTSWGGQVEAGYSMPIGATAFWEPVGSLAYVDTTFGALPVPGGLDQMGADNSFRGSLGVRLGLTQDFQYYKVKLAVTGRVWDEFENNPTGTLIVAGGSDFANSDDLRGVFGEVSGQANLFSTSSGLSAFLTGGVKFKSDYNEGTVTIGARYQW